MKASANPEGTMQNLPKDVIVARELAILGDYDEALRRFQKIYAAVHNYSRRYEAAGGAGAVGREKQGYAAQTASSQKKRNAHQGVDATGAPGGTAGDIYLQEKWSTFKKNLKSEFDGIAQMHLLL